MKLTGVVLAGGKSERMGEDKGLMMYGHRTFTERAAEVLIPFCEEVVVSTNNPAFEKLPFITIRDRKPGFGPMMGIYSSLLACNLDGILVLAVDNLFVTPSFFTYLLGQELEGVDAAVPFLNGRHFEPLVGYYSRSCLPAMEEQIVAGNYKLPDLFSLIRMRKLCVDQDFPEYREGYFTSINQPGDLDLLR